MAYEITGAVNWIGEVEAFASGFKKQTIILDVESGQYVNQLGFEFTKDNTDKLSGIKVGDNVTIEVWDIGTRANYYEAKDKWFPNFPNPKGIKVNQAGAEPATSAPDAPMEEDPFDGDVPF